MELCHDQTLAQHQNPPTALVTSAKGARWEPGCRRLTGTPYLRGIENHATGIPVNAVSVGACQSRRRRRRASAEPRASRRADRAPPTSSRVRRSCRRHTRAPCRVRRRVSSDITAPAALLVASPARLCQSRRRRRRASAEPRASRRADRAPPTSSCVRRSRRRHTRAPCRVRRRVSSDITAPPALLVASPTRLCQSRRQ